MSKLQRGVARDISYAASVRGRSGRVLVRALENATGRLTLIRKARGYDVDVASGQDFWDVIVARYGIELEIVGGAVENIPETGPVVVVCNHPYGILDGLILGRIMALRRGGDFRVLAHEIFRRAPDLKRMILPISFDSTKESAKLNLETRAAAVTYISQGGAIGVFPGGTVSTAATPFSAPLDPSWRTFTAKMVSKSGATVVPIFFEGHNSRLFQLASHIHANLRLGLLIREFRKRVNKPVRIVIGTPIKPETLAAYKKDPKGCMDFLRKATYDLSPSPVDTNCLGHEFEVKHKVRDGRRNIR
jgi:putative hemolysin